MESGGNLSYLFFFPQPQPHSILACLFLENRQLHAIVYTHSPFNSARNRSVSKRREQQALLTCMIEDLSGRVLVWSLVWALYLSQCFHLCCTWHWCWYLNPAKFSILTGRSCCIVWTVCSEICCAIQLSSSTLLFELHCPCGFNSVEIALCCCDGANRVDI